MCSALVANNKRLKADLNHQNVRLPPESGRKWRLRSMSVDSPIGDMAPLFADRRRVEQAEIQSVLQVAVVQVIEGWLLTV